MGTISFVHQGVVLSAFDSANGLKTTALAIHGGLADHRAALRLVDSIADRARVLAPDLRGAGRSHFSGPLSWELLASDVVALLDHLAIDRVVVVGTSMGAGVALRLALDAPDRIGGLVILSPMYLGADTDLDPAQVAALDRMAEFGARAERDGIEALFPIYDALPTAIRARATTMARDFDPASVAATTRFLASGAQPFTTLGDLRAITARTSIVPGIDAQHPRAVAEAYLQVFPNALSTESADAPSVLRDFMSADD